MLFDRDQQRSSGPPRCPNCGTELDPSYRFCITCGADVSAVRSVPSGALVCRNCGARLDPSYRYCINCGTPYDATERRCPTCGNWVTSNYRYCTSCGTDVSAITGAAWVPAKGLYPVHFDVQYPARLSRLTTFFRLILAIPQLLIVYALGTVVGVVTLIAFFAIFFTRRYPRGLFNLVAGFNRWIANVYVYLALLQSDYPPFSMDPGRYPVLYEVEYPERLSRWLIFVKWLLALGHGLVLNFVSIVGYLLTFFAWFAILFRGRYPRSFFDFNVGLMRWYLRVGAYSGLMRDEFPPFSMRADAKPGSGKMIALAAFLGIISVVSYAVFFYLFAFSSVDSQTIEVPYQSVRTGVAAPPVDVAGNDVVLLSASDPYEAGGAARPAPGYRLVAFALEVTNRESILTSVSRRTFSLKDSRGETHEAIRVLLSPPLTTTTLEEGESVTVTVIFQVDTRANPRRLKYVPSVFAFPFFGGEVNYVFR